MKRDLVGSFNDCGCIAKRERRLLLTINPFASIDDFSQFHFFTILGEEKRQNTRAEGELFVVISVFIKAVVF